LAPLPGISKSYLEVERGVCRLAGDTVCVDASFVLKLLYFEFCPSPEFTIGSDTGSVGSQCELKTFDGTAYRSEPQGWLHGLRVGLYGLYAVMAKVPERRVVTQAAICNDRNMNVVLMGVQLRDKDATPKAAALS
jgi:hypothetical protein